MRFLPILAAVILTFASVPAASGQQLHAILAADTDCNPPNVGIGVGVDIQGMSKLLADGLGNRVTITKLTGNQVTANNITRMLRKLQINRNDTVLFYYYGHGGYDRNQGHFFALSHGRSLLRSDRRQGYHQTV